MLPESGGLIQGDAAILCSCSGCSSHQTGMITVHRNLQQQTKGDYRGKGCMLLMGMEVINLANEVNKFYIDTKIQMT